MNKRLVVVILLLGVVSGIIYSPGCGGGSDSWPGHSTADPALVIAVLPANPHIVKGAQQQFQALGRYWDGDTRYLTDVAWYSSDTNIATIDTIGGTATGLEIGKTTITVWHNDQQTGYVSGTTTLTVTE